MPPKPIGKTSASKAIGANANRVGPSSSGATSSSSSSTAKSGATTAIDSIKKSAAAGTLTEAAVISAAGQTSQTAPVTHKRSQMEADFDRFRSYDKLEEGVDAIGPKGFNQLCNELGISPNSMDSFILSWSLGATQSMCITRSEWMHAQHLHNVEHLGQLKAALKGFNAKVKENDSFFTEMYQAAYDFIRGDDEKLLPLEKAIKVWTILLAERFPMLSQWTTFCAVEFKRPVSRDIWRMIEEFSRKVKNIADYDPNDKWPCALDEFVESLQSKKSSK